MKEWISIKDELPQEDFMVIAASDDDVFATHFRCGFVDGDYWFDIERQRGIEVTHWMPLPEPPQQ